MSILIISLLVIVFTSIVIMYAVDSFEAAADYLGRDMKPGVKGATLNAVGSSLPELFTSFIFLFGPVLLPAVFGVHSGSDHFSAAVATTAGSAVFNAVIIPALSILAVTIVGIKSGNGRKVVEYITLNKRVVIKDGIFLFACEFLLIWFLSDSYMKWWMGGALALAYGVYIAFTLGFGFEAGDDEEDDEAEEEEASKPGLLGLRWLLDFNNRFFGGAAFTNYSAWMVLLASVVVIGIACAGIVWGVENSAAAIGIQSYFTAVILAAAATSVPDTVLSVKDALKGQYDDAVANAIGSNIFDITIGLGIPLFLYGLAFGDVHLAAQGAAADVQALRWVLLAVTCVVVALLIVGSRVSTPQAIILLLLYGAWLAFIVGRASEAEWTNLIMAWIPGHAPQ